MTDTEKCTLIEPYIYLISSLSKWFIFFGSEHDFQAVSTVITNIAVMMNLHQRKDALSHRELTIDCCCYVSKVRVISYR